jgi:hypothetical protein
MATPPLTPHDRALLRRLQDAVARLRPGCPYEISVSPDRFPCVLSHGAAARGEPTFLPPSCLSSLAPYIRVSGYLDARVFLHGDDAGWQAERLSDGPPGLRIWTRGSDWADVLRLDLADGETLEVGPSAHARAALARALAPLGADPLAAPDGLAERIRDVLVGRLHGLRFQRHRTLRLVVAADTPRSGWRPVALLEEEPSCPKTLSPVVPAGTSDPPLRPSPPSPISLRKARRRPLPARPAPLRRKLR